MQLAKVYLEQPYSINLYKNGSEFPVDSERIFHYTWSNINGNEYAYTIYQLFEEEEEGGYVVRIAEWYRKKDVEKIKTNNFNDFPTFYSKIKYINQKNDSRIKEITNRYPQLEDFLSSLQIQINTSSSVKENSLKGWERTVLEKKMDFLR